jgi:cytochrome c oxidase subunit 3
MSDLALAKLRDRDRARDDAPGGERRATVTVGMTVALAAIAMTFAALLLAYGIVRVQSPLWPPAGEPALPALWGLRLAATFAALLGSWAMRAAARTDTGPVVTPASAARLARALAIATASGLAFLGLQFASLRALGAAGVHPGSGLVSSVIYALTAFHGLHALAAVLLSVWLLATLRRAPPARLPAVAWFWHLVTAIWLVVFVAVFVA